MIKTMVGVGGQGDRPFMGVRAARRKVMVLGAGVGGGGARDQCAERSSLY